MKTRDNHWRLDLYAPGAAEPSASVWADVRPVEGEPADLLLALCHPYPDVAVGAGWRAVRRGVAWDVVEVQGRQLTCRETRS